MPTQHDIARRCRVSRSTVAAVLSKRPSTAVVGDRTRQRVLKTAAALGYRPNAAARSLRSGRTFALALAVPNFSAMRGAISSRIFEGVGQEAMDLGYSVSICHYDEAHMPSSLERMLQESRFDGVLLYGDNESDSDPREAILARMGVPFVELEKNRSEYPAVAFDNIGGVRLAVDHLVGHGRRRLAVIATHGGFSRERLLGFQRALRAHGLDADPRLTVKLPLGYSDAGRPGVLALLESGAPFDALFCVTDDIAMGAIQTLVEHGRRVPEDVAVVGFDDAPSAWLSNPALTSVQQDGVALGRAAVELLVRGLAGEAPKSRPQVLPTRLAVRRSCGCGREPAKFIGKTV